MVKPKGDVARLTRALQRAKLSIEMARDQERFWREKCKRADDLSEKLKIQMSEKDREVEKLTRSLNLADQTIFELRVRLRDGDNARTDTGTLRHKLKERNEKILELQRKVNALTK